MIDVDSTLKHAVRLHRTGRLEHAAAAYHQILAFMPAHAEALHLLGLVYREKGALDCAKALIQQAINYDRKAALFYVSYADILQLEGRLSKAMDWYRKALRLQPDMAQALCNMGNAFREQGRFPQAIACYKKALGLNPRSPHLYNNLGLAHHAQKQYGAAEDCFNKSICLDPANVDAYNNLGNLYRDGLDFEAAMKQYQRALGLAPENTTIHYNLGVLFHMNKEAEKAAFHYRKAVECQPPIVDAYNNLGIFCQDRNQPDQAIGYYEKAIEQDPNHFDAHFNRSLALLATGRFEEGWEAFEWRFKRDAWRRIYPHRLDGRQWDGRPFAGQTLFIHSEQGFGDTIWFARYLPQVKSMGGTVVFEVRRDLVELMQQVDGVDHLITMSFDEPPEIAYDWYLPLMSLPRVFATTLDSIPATVPYLCASEERRKFWAIRIKGSGLKVGLVWSAKATNEHNRSCPAEYFQSLCRLKNVRIFGLQKGEDALQADSLPVDVINFGPKFKSFADTAGAIACLDLVISVDTAVAHLAGAMGKPVWVLLPYAADWKWLMDRWDSPWYPTMRLFRQPRPGDWESVLRMVSARLRRWIDRINSPCTS